MSDCLAESRSRASMTITGTSVLSWSASRTSSGLCRSRPSKALTATTNGSPRASKKSSGPKQSSRRRVSTSTTAPIAPRTRSSHMNQNRFCPGEPNRYSTSSSSIEMRPKSMATVVVVLFGVAVRSSTPTDADVITASVRSGTISETAPTKVVFPAPNPPDTTIFVDREGRRSEPLKATEHPPQECWVTLVAIGGGGLEDLDEPEVNHVGDDHAGHSERNPELGRDLRDGDRPLADLDHGVVLGGQQGALPCLPAVGGRQHERLEVQLPSRLRPAPGAGIRPHEGGVAGLAGVAPSRGRVLGHVGPGRRSASVAGPGRRRRPRRPELGGQVLPDAVHEHRHLVAHEADVGGGRGQHRQPRP